MIVTILFGAMLQTTPLRPEVWKERNQPDMPVFQPCEVGAGTTIAHSLKQLPVYVTTELTRYLNAAILMSDAGGPFNSTDIIDGLVPQRRFLRAYQTKRYWIIWYERGGFVAGPRTIALRRDAARGSRESTFRIVPGTAFAGDLCAATRAILSGVRSASS